MKLKVYGHSDDLVCIDSDNEKFSQEFSYPWDADGSYRTYLGFSDGTLLEIWYSGTWFIRRKMVGVAKCWVQPADGIESSNYSDIAHLEGNIKWVVFGRDILQRQTDEH